MWCMPHPDRAWAVGKMEFELKEFIYLLNEVDLLILKQYFVFSGPYSTYIIFVKVQFLSGFRVCFRKSW